MLPTCRFVTALLGKALRQSRHLLQRRRLYQICAEGVPRRELGRELASAEQGFVCIDRGVVDPAESSQKAILDALNDAEYGSIIAAWPQEAAA